MAWIIFGACCWLGALTLALALCRAAKRGDEIAGRWQ